ncbi:hypothetical protein PC120_g20314 [Phytophthora cactorum]|nr:hypothetical protein PC120_g20314 [Phytophthora cactorum]
MTTYKEVERLPAVPSDLDPGALKPFADQTAYQAGLSADCVAGTIVYDFCGGIDSGNGELKDIPAEVVNQNSTRAMWSHSLFKLYSWTLKDYEKAVQHDAFFDSIERMLPAYREEPDNMESEAMVRSKGVQEKYFVIGGSARVMFDFPPVSAVKYLETAIDAVSDIDTWAKVLTGNAASNTINRLVAI